MIIIIWWRNLWILKELCIIKGIELIHDTRRLCTRALRTDQMKAIVRGIKGGNKW